MFYEQLLFTLLYQLPALVLGLVIKRLRVWPQLRFFLLLPGTIAHEGLHWIVAFFTNGQPKGITVWPKRSPDGGWVLGAVGVANSRWYNAFLIGIAPILGIGIILLATPSAIHWQLSQRDCIQWLITAPMWVMCWPSGADLRAGLASLSTLWIGLSIVLIVVICWFTYAHFYIS
jgi:hypothetical protein